MKTNKQLTIHPVIIFLAFIYFAIPFQSIAQESKAHLEHGQIALEIDDNDVDEFVNVLQKIASVKDEYEDLMIMVIEENHLTVDKFNNIVVARQENPDARVEGITEDELSIFERIVQNILVLQQDLQNKIVEIIAEDNIDLETFHTLLAIYQADPQFQEMIHKRLE